MKKIVIMSIVSLILVSLVLAADCDTADFDGDGHVDRLDMALFMEHWLETGCDDPNSACHPFDLDGNGNIAGGDIGLWAGCYEASCNDKDFNNDGQVNDADVELFGEHWLQTGCSDAGSDCYIFDLDGNGIVAGNDLGLFAGCYEQENTPCIDTDSGRDTSEYGKAYSSNGAEYEDSCAISSGLNAPHTLVDSCSGSNCYLLEAECANHGATFAKLLATSGCENGVFVEIEDDELPDLVIKNLIAHSDNNEEDGAAVWVEYDLKNIGKGPVVDKFLITIFVNGVANNNIWYWRGLGDDKTANYDVDSTLPVLRPGESVKRAHKIYFQSAYNSMENHKITVEADTFVPPPHYGGDLDDSYDNLVEESREDNNGMTVIFNFNEKPPTECEICEGGKPTGKYDENGCVIYSCPTSPGQYTLTCSNADFNCDKKITKDDAEVIAEIWKKGIQLDLSYVTRRAAECKPLGEYLGYLWRSGISEITLSESTRVAAAIVKLEERCGDYKPPIACAMCENGIPTGEFDANGCMIYECPGIVLPVKWREFSLKIGDKTKFPENNIQVELLDITVSTLTGADVVDKNVYYANVRISDLADYDVASSNAAVPEFPETISKKGYSVTKRIKQGEVLEFNGGRLKFMDVSMLKTNPATYLANFGIYFSSKPPLPELTYHSAFFRCVDGYEETRKEACRSQDEWLNIAEKTCKLRCSSDDSGLCGVLKFDVDDVCTLTTKPICGNGICEAGEGQVCTIEGINCKEGKLCEVKKGSTCYIRCPDDCDIPDGIYANLNEKFRLRVGQPVKITNYNNMKIKFLGISSSKCDYREISVSETSVNSITGNVVKETEGEIIEISSIEEAERPIEVDKTKVGTITKCNGGQIIAKLEVSIEERPTTYVTIKLGERKNIFGVTLSFLDYYSTYRAGVFLVSEGTFDCPEECICSADGTIECPTKPECSEGTVLCPDGTCQKVCTPIVIEECKFGCLYGESCLPIGTRVEGKYCNIKRDLEEQKNEGENCENNFECTTNICVNSQCISKNLLQKIFSWFAGMFGG